MRQQYSFTSGKIGNGTSHFQNTTISTSRQREALHSNTKHIKRLRIGLGVLMKHAFGHLSIAMYSLERLVSLFLNMACSNNTFTNCGT